MVSRSARCQQHRAVPAGWRCDGCQKYLCADCTARVLTQFYCCLCDQPATQLAVPRSERSFVDWIAAALVYPLRRGLWGLLVLAALATGARLAAVAVLDPSPGHSPSEGRDDKPPAATTAGGGDDAPAAVPTARDAASTPERPLSPTVFPPIRALLILVYIVLVVIATARGDKSGPRVVLLTIKALAGTAILWLPAAAYLVLVVRGLPGSAELATPMPWLFAGLAAVYLPMALAAAASDAAFREVINPFRLFAWAVQTGRHYWLTVVSVALLAGLAHALARAGAQAGQRVHVVFLGGLVAELLALFAFAAMARLMGRILWVHGDAFDWGSERDFCDPLLKDDARGTRKRALDAAPAAGQAAGGEGGGAVREKPEGMLAKEVIQALGQRSNLRALKLYESRPSWNEQLFTDRHRLDLGTAALNASKAALAEKLLARVAQTKGPIAGRALLGLARAHQQLGSPPESIRALWQQIVDRYPGTDMARAAAANLDGAAPVSGLATATSADEKR